MDIKETERQLTSQVQELAQEVQKDLKQNIPSLDAPTQPFFNRKLSSIIRIALMTLIILIGVTIFSISLALFVQQKTSLDQFNQFLSSLNIGLISLFLGTLFLMFSLVTVLVFLRRKMLIGLHIYWIIALFFLSAIALGLVSAVQFKNDENSCVHPNSYFFEKLKLLSQNADSFYCSDQCPCPSNNSAFDGSSLNTSNQTFSNVMKCAGWQESSYSNLMASAEQYFQCSGWCSISTHEMPVFSDFKFQVTASTSTCYQAISDVIQSKCELLEILGGIVCGLLLLVIMMMNCQIMLLNEKQVLQNHHISSNQQEKKEHKISVHFEEQKQPEKLVEKPQEISDPKLMANEFNFGNESQKVDPKNESEGQQI